MIRAMISARFLAFTLLLAGLLTLTTTSAPAAVDKDKVNAAIKRGLDFLRKNGRNDTSHGSGVPALVGLAMLEGGVPKDDSALASIIGIVRSAAYSDVQTYNVALDILFLDKLNDPSDVPLIQVLGCRLLAGQTPAGGWGYATFGTVSDVASLQSALRKASNNKLHPEAERIYNGVRSGQLRIGGNGDDNSNTQFAIVGLWVAQRRGVPCIDAFKALDTRFLRSQSPRDFGWNYNVGGGDSSTPAMTCAGLLGLAVGKAAAETKPSDLAAMVNEQQPQNKEAAKDQEKQTDPFFNPPAKGAKPKTDDEPEEPENADEPPAAMKKARTIRDAAIERALKALGTVIGGKGSGVPLGAAGHGWGGVSDLYFIWSLERVAVAYGLPTIGDVDWYNWGCNMILPAQQADGSWNGSHNSNVETAFALLFLMRANFTGDLTRSLGGKVKDPGAGELRGSRGGPLPIIAQGRMPDPKGPADPTAPNVNRVRGPSEADLIAEGLLKKQTEVKWKGKLDAVKDAKGGQNTAGLAIAIPFLSEKRQLAAREALADRLSRMTSKTLEKMLEERDSELRRAACLAIAMKDDKKLTLQLIERVMDIDDSVVRAARAALKAMFNRDFGPNTSANDERKRAAYDEWILWFKTEGPRQ